MWILRKTGGTAHNTVFAVRFDTSTPFSTPQTCKTLGNITSNTTDGVDGKMV